METVPFYPMQRATECPFDPPPGLREMGPIGRVRIWDGSTPWVVTGYEAHRFVLSDQRFSADARRDGYPAESAAVAERIHDFRSLIMMDEPEHGAQRRMLSKNFTLKSVEAMRPRVAQIVDGLIDDLLAGPNPVDLVAAFALPVPSLVICELLGVPYDGHDFFQDCSRKLFSQSCTVEETLEAHVALQEYMLKLVDAKDTEPGDDMISRLVAEQLRPGNLSRAEIAEMALLMLVAGHESTANMIALGTLALLRHPDQLAALRDADDPKEIAGAVDELLRYLSVVHVGRRRVATEDVELAGQLVKAGEGVILADGASNRDESVFPAPDTLDLQRKGRQHVAFGYGSHQCLGQLLARMELQVVCGTLYRRIPTLKLAIPFDEVQFKHDMVVYGVRSLPVSW
ncbi:cytochrome P450 [Kutzneria sp. CA-103260]|uniref:cytochrome P450 n=1 Tax=Kutzneria sp. CA-103260 TaxID=2802641 RepID=UPI001BAA5D55|nr:cytochrome P450 [Kutzneria sp. CA-103260]QUQ64178.1 cytochrome P450 [Kutzneria sp. CA-103260]